MTDVLMKSRMVRPLPVATAKRSSRLMAANRILRKRGPKSASRFPEPQQLLARGLIRRRAISN
jgi:hypothetical protein